MKKTITLLTVISLLLSLCIIGVSAEKNTAQVTVTIAVKGELVVTQAQVEVTDVDDDGALTVNDALYAVHKKLYEGGADAGYGYYQSEYGLSMSKLWGDESGMYGYYLNNASCMNLADPIKNDDHIVAFVYKNADWSDIYCYFEGDDYGFYGEPITLTLTAAGYDENWNPITYPVEGATITVDGQPIDLVTDAQGKFTLIPEDGQAKLLSATSDTVTLVPPALHFYTIHREDSTPRGVCKSTIGIPLIALIPLACLCIKRKEN